MFSNYIVMLLLILLLYTLSAHGFLLNLFNNGKSYNLFNNGKSNCPSQPTYPGHLVAHLDKCYEFILNVQGDWMHAQKDCQNKGGHLVTIQSSSEQHGINQWLDNFDYHTKGVWIGLNDIQNEGTYVWDSGKLVVYRNWGDGQPDDYRNNQHQDCVLLYVPHHTVQYPNGHVYAAYAGTPGWHDQSCQEINFGWICEYDGFSNHISHTTPSTFHLNLTIHNYPTQHPSATSIPRNSKGCPIRLTYLSFHKTLNNKCYEVIFTKKSWIDALNDCKSKEGNLVTIQSMEEERFLNQYLRSLFYVGTGVWIGLNDRGHEGRYTWESGKPGNFSHWDAGQPSDKNSIFKTRNCVQMYKSSGLPHQETDKNGRSHSVYPDSPGWHDHSCYDVEGWICEYYIPQSPATTTLTTATATSKAKPSTTSAQITKISPTSTMQKLPSTTSTPTSTVKSTTTGTSKSTRTTTPVPFIIGK